MSKSKKAPKKVEPKVVVLLVEKIPAEPSELQKAKDAFEAKLQGIIDDHKPGAQLSAELNAEIHCHDCKKQVAVDDLFCPWCGIALIGKCGNCGIEKARKDPCPICPKAS